jgi:hypothetical protein
MNERPTPPQPEQQQDMPGETEAMTPVPIMANTAMSAMAS